MKPLPLLFSALLAGSFVAAAQVTLTVDGSPPDTAVIVSLGSDGGSYTTVFDDDSNSANAGADRGQTFTTPTIAGTPASWEVSEIAVVADATRNLSAFPGATFSLWVFRWNGADANDRSSWSGIDGTSDGNPFDGSGLTTFLVNGVSVPANRTFAGNDVLHFRFNTPLVLAEDAAYGFLLSLDDGAANPGAGQDFRLQITRTAGGGSYPDGFNLIAQPDGANATNEVRDDLRFYLVGTPAGGGETDSDNDGMDDSWEQSRFGSLVRDGTGDFDGDGLSDLDEFQRALDPTNRDSDGDILGDGEEVATYGTDPGNPDSDRDGNPDGFEVGKGLDPLDAGSRVERPNIIFIMADDMGYGDVGALWQNSQSGMKHSTPHLDAMAAQGMILDRHYTPAPVCAPCRGSLLTGLHQGHCTINDTNFDEALPDNHTLGTTMQRAGYATAMIGKHGLQGSGGSAAAWPAYPTKRGFDFYHGYVRHSDGHQHYPGDAWPLGNSTAHRSPKQLWENEAEISGDLSKCFTPDLFTARAKAWIAEHRSTSPEQPFFLYLAYDTPHAALQLATQAYPANPGLTGGVQWLGTGNGPAINTATGTIDSYYHPDYANQGSWTDAEKRFASLMRRMDNNLGDLLQTLRDLEIAENTLVVWTSDNGPHAETYMSGNGGGYNASSFNSFGPHEGIKRDCWEGGVRMPTIAWWPGTIGGGSIDVTPSQMHDWLPTFADLGGVIAPAKTDGVSLAPLLTGVGTQREPLVYIEFNHNGSAPNYPEFTNHGGETRNQAQVIHLEGYKGIRTGTNSHADDFEIYNINTDPKEANNLAGRSGFFNGLQQRMKDRVLRVRNNQGTASRPWDAEQVPAVNTPVEPGIEWAAYEGHWAWVPEFTELTPTATGEATQIDAASHLTRTDDGGLLYTGFLSVPAGGTWTFHLTSDSGAFLRIHDSSVVDDDFQHDGTSSSGSIILAPGLHPFRLYYRSLEANPTLRLEWSGPGIPRQEVPSANLMRAGTPQPEPQALNDAATTTGNSPLSIDVLANDLDDGLPAALAIQSVTDGEGGTTSISGGEVVYRPNPGFLGTDRFSYTVTDSQFTATASVEVTVVHLGSDLWLPLAECSGTAVFEAGGMMAGSLSGSSDADAARIPGVFGRALRLDGTDDEVPLGGIPDALLPSGSAPRTVMCWVRVPPGRAFENQTMFGYGTNVSGQRFSFRLNGSASSPAGQELRLEVQSGNIIGTTPLDDGQWHHVAAVCDDFDRSGTMDVSETRLYVDGVREAISASTPRTMNTTPGTTALLGGSNHASGYNFAGDIDELRLLPRALSQTEVQAAMRAGQQEALAWHRRFFGDGAVDWLADEDGDGYDRLLEYGLGGQPWIWDRPSLEPIHTISPSNGRLQTTFPRRMAGSHGLAYTLEVSRDLETWNELGATETTATAVSPADCLERVTFETDTEVGAEPRQFTRIRVELLP